MPPPRKHKPRISQRLKSAQDITQRYSQEELREVMKLTPSELDVLNKIASGHPPRNAIAILKAINTKAEMAYSKPKQEIEHSGGLTVTVQINRRVDYEKAGPDED